MCDYTPVETRPHATCDLCGETGSVLVDLCDIGPRPDVSLDERCLCATCAGTPERRCCAVCDAPAFWLCDFGSSYANLRGTCRKSLCYAHSTVEAQVWDVLGDDGVDIRRLEHRALCQERTHVGAPCCAPRKDLQYAVYPYLWQEVSHA